jgi:large conductance mechanosensitive channel
MLLGKVPFADLMIHLNDKTAIKYGVFLNNILDFVIVAFCIFLVVRQMNHLKSKFLPTETTTKACPQCLSTIPLKAKRCAFCTSEVE